MEVVPRPSTPIQHYGSETKSAGNNAPEVVQQYQDGDKIGSPALLIYQPHAPAPPPQDPSSWQQHNLTPLGGSVPTEHQYYHRHGGSPTLPVPPVDDLRVRSEKKRLCGIRRRIFVGLLILAWLAIVGIAVGVGVKFGVLDRNQGEDSTSGSTSNSSLASLQCPNGATTQIQTSNGAKFLHLCGIDYSGAEEATDIANERTSTFKECLELCAKTQGCTGAGWGPALADKLARATCWMKSDLNLSHSSPPDWNFGIRLD